MTYLLLTASNNSMSSGNGYELIEGMLKFVTGLSVLSIIIALLMPVIMLIILTVLGFITSDIAGKKGYNRFGFFLYGFFFFPIAVGVAILAPAKVDDKAISDAEEIAKYEEMYKAGTITHTQLSQKKEEIELRKYRK